MSTKINSKLSPEKKELSKLGNTLASLNSLSSDPLPPLDFSDYFGKESLETINSLLLLISKPLFKRYHTNIHHRFINWWDSQKAIELELDPARKISFTNFMWIKTVEQLRELNFSISYLAELRLKLFAPISLGVEFTNPQKAESLIQNLKISEREKKELLKVITQGNLSKNEPINLFQLIILESILKRKPMGLALFSDNEFIIIDKQKAMHYTSEQAERLEFGTYIHVSISKLISQFLCSDVAFKSINEFPILSPNENKVFAYIQSGEYDTILINFKDRKVKSMELKKGVDVKTKIIDILKIGEYAEIHIKKHKGTIAKIEQALKIAF